jgi:hypothetical protein
MPGVEYWTTSDFTWGGMPVKKVGINLNAPGDRMAENGLLWLDYPSVGGPSPDIPVELSADKANFIRRHSAFLPQCKTLPWVCASAICGVQSLEITLSQVVMPQRLYSIRLYFAELEEVKEGERIVNIEIQGEEVLSDFDIVKEAGGRGIDIVKLFRDIEVTSKLLIRFTPSELAPESRAILSGIEIVSNELMTESIGKASD